VHALAVPPSDAPAALLAAAAIARGDGVVEVFDASGGSTQSSSGANHPGVALSFGPAHGGHRRAASCLAFCPADGGRRLASGGDDRRLLLWDCLPAPAAPPLLWQARVRHKLQGICWLLGGGNDGSATARLAVGDAAGGVSLYDIT
jgi:WD40 repeat protein